MKRLLLLLAAVLALVALWWSFRSTTRGTPPPAATAKESHERAAPAELVAAVPPPIETEASDVARSAREPNAERARLASEPAAARSLEAPVHGRLVVAETGDPIAEVVTVRLRTLDLECKEELLTNPDGSFVSASAYRSGVLLALVKDRDGQELADHEAGFDPAASEEWLVRIPSRKYPTLARGTIVDRRGDPVGEVPVRIVARSHDGSWNEVLSGEDGRFELKELRAGSHALLVQRVWRPAEPMDVVLHAGINELGTVVLDETRGAGLLVRFACAEDSADFPAALVVVRPEGAPRDVPFYSYVAEERGGGVFELRLPSIPAGEATLSVESLDGRTYALASGRVRVPGEVEIRVTGETSSGRMLRVRDAETGEPLLAFDAWRRWRGVWSISGIKPFHGESSGALELHTADAWIVLAKDHRGARGGGKGAQDVEVVLARGWSELLVFEDVLGDTSGNLDFGRMRPLLEGVEVFADGVRAGVSDADGTFLFEGNAPPAELAFRLQGWRMVREHRSENLHMVWMMRGP